MSVAMTNCGIAGWVSDRTGYRYDRIDPLSGKPRPAMPPAFLEAGAGRCCGPGFQPFQPDVVLINRYEPGARLSLHQDRDEKGYIDPIVSVSLGLPAVFQWGAGTSGATGRNAYRWRTVTSLYGADLHGCDFMASCR